MRFAHPSLLYWIFALPILFVFIRGAQRKKKDRFSRFIQSALWPKLAPELDWEAPVRKLRAFTVCLFFLILAASQPQWGKIEEKVRTNGMDVLVVLDLSRSMEVEDVVPSRLKKAKHLIRSLLERIQGDRVGIVGFAASSFLACPLTTDLSYISELIEILGPDWIQSQGSDLGIALDTALRALDRGAEEGAKKPQASQSLTSQAVIVFTDGEDHELEAIKQAARLKEAGIHFFVVGVGSEKGGPVPIRDEGSQLRGYRKSKSGEAVVSRMNPKYLEEVASAGGGHYWTATTPEIEIEEIVKNLSGLTRGEVAERSVVIYQDRFQYPLALALVFLLHEWSLLSRRKRSDLTKASLV